ncbi:hypothetical protein LEP1GSC163_2680 [Leptospira santarosai str. CBC379]|nr:hypothetical protein LEP1GSC163_2680 [Leptospira santarosai str. CBC379]
MSEGAHLSYAKNQLCEKRSMSEGAHLCYAKNLRLRSAIYGYLAL